MPETAKRVKRSFQDKNREIVEVDDPAAKADVVVTVGTRTDALKP